MFDPFTLVGLHTWLSLVAIAAGIPVVAALIGAGAAGPAATLFLTTALLTSATGFALPASGILPSHGVGLLALVVLTLALIALYAFRLAGAWRSVHAVAMVASLYFLVFVGIAQAFQKVPALRALAPTGSEPAFLAAQLVTLAAFVALGIGAVRAGRHRSAAV